MVSISIWIVIILAALGLLAIVVFGIRSLAYGKISTRTLLIMVIPVLLLIVLGLIVPWDQAAIYAVLITLVLAVIALFGSGLMSMFR